MADIVLVLLLLAFIWAAVLIGPAAGAQASREAEFLGSIRPDGHDELDAVDQPRFRPALTANARRRQVLGGLMVSIGATLALGILPPFRLLLFVHLLLVNSCLAYVGLLVHLRDKQAAHARVTTPARGRDADERPAARFAEPVHPYAPDEVEYADEFDYQGDPWAGDEPAYAYAYAETYPSAEDGDYGDYGDDEAEAAYIDDELAQPA